MKRVGYILAVALAAALAFLVYAETSNRQDTSAVVVWAQIETAPVPHDGDAADDPAIWIHPTRAELSTVIGTDKKGGLAVYDLAGSQLQYVETGRMNNVDIRHKFPLAGETVALVAASDRSDGTIDLYRVDPSTRQLVNMTSSSLDTGVSIYGLCMYHSPISGKHFVFINSVDGEVQQWELFDAGDGRVSGRIARSFQIGGRPEGCVADDEMAYYYLGEESRGIWKYGAEPADANAPTLIDTVGDDGHLKGQVEGLALYYMPNGTGYLVASSQVSNDFVIYRREGNNAYVGRFSVGGGHGIDEVTHTDGLDVTSIGLGEQFPSGILILQDHENTDPDGYQNFKLVPWHVVADALRLDAAIESPDVTLADTAVMNSFIEIASSTDRR